MYVKTVKLFLFPFFILYIFIYTIYRLICRNTRCFLNILCFMPSDVIFLLAAKPQHTDLPSIRRHFHNIVHHTLVDICRFITTVIILIVLTNKYIYTQRGMMSQVFSVQ